MKLIEVHKLAKIGTAQLWLFGWEHCGVKVDSTAAVFPAHQQATLAAYMESIELAQKAMRWALKQVMQSRPKSRVSAADQHRLAMCALDAMGLRRSRADANSLIEISKKAIDKPEPIA